jgi:hypothetical protein
VPEYEGLLLEDPSSEEGYSHSLLNIENVCMCLVYSHLEVGQSNTWSHKMCLMAVISGVHKSRGPHCHGT